ncbi:MAG: MipA/OmpV family protein [Bacteriovoracaceae bacterium]|jgi:MipA family protein|nr:MipA/OmpV family protein [Bacteriovoracaceae bacterium]
MKLISIFFISFFIFISASMAQSYRLDQENLPVMEAGLGIGWANFPYYPGASKRRNFVLPYPAFIFRGDKVRADEDGGMRGRFFSNERFEINTSVGFSLPVNSDDVPSRYGMDNLDPLFELGPGVIYHFIPAKKGRRYTLSLNLGTRIAISSDFKHTKHKGYVLHPLLFGWYKIHKNLTVFNGLSATWATKDYHNHFYRVKGRESGALRPSYEAKGGNMSITLSTFFIFNFLKKWSVFGGAVMTSYDHASNKDSPLHIKDHTVSGITGLTFWFYQSDKKQKI